MRVHRWLMITLLLALVAGLTPALAADNEPVKDKGQNVYEVYARKSNLYNVLPGEEAEKIRMLQQERRSVVLLSAISPDDQAVLALRGDDTGFLGVQDGSFVPIDPSAFDRIFPVGLFGAFGGTFWLDGHTLGSLGFAARDPGPDDQGPASAPVLVTIDRATGELGSIPLPDFPQRSTPISAAPDGSRILLIKRPPPQENQSVRVATAQVSWPGVTALGKTTGLSSLQQRIEAWLAKDPARQLRPLLEEADQSEVNATADESKVLVYETATGKQRELRSLPVGTVPVAVAWSQDGARLALSLTGLLDAKKQPDPRMERLPYDGALLSEQVYRDVTGNLAPGENPFFQNDIVEVYDLNAGSTKTLHAADGDGQFLAGISWSTDGQTLMVQAFHPGRLAGRRYPIYALQFAERTSFRFYNADLQQIGQFTPSQLSAARVAYGGFVSPDEVIFTGLVGTNIHPYYYNRVSGEFRDIGDRAGTYADVRATRFSRQIVFGYSSFTSPPDIYRLQWDGAALARLTWDNEELRLLSKTRQDPVSFRLASGQVRSGVLIQPADAPFPPKKTRIVVWQEGGPGVPMNNQWLTYVEAPYALLPNFGLALLVVPLAGRPGYGPATYNALYDRSNFGQRDIDEQAEIVRQMIARGWTAKGKVGITGCSYGGYFTWQSIIRYPDLYAAANPQCALVDTIVEWNRGYAALMPYIEGLPPWAAPEEYRRDSPIYNAGKVKAAVLTFHGSEDFLPVTLNENLHLQLVNRGVPARMLLFVRAGHGLVSPVFDFTDPESFNYPKKYELFAAQEQIQWFRQYLK